MEKSKTSNIKEDSKPLDKRITEFLNTNEVYKKFPITNTEEPRLKLPFKWDITKKVNVWDVLKHNLGKELSRITMPVTFNEPLSLLQRTVAFIEYKELFELANKCEDKGLQCAYILSAFFILYSGTVGTSKKPFNPLLGETYEILGEDGLRMISEQVSHHPPVSAFWGENSEFRVQGYMFMNTEISMQGFQINPVGRTFVTLKKSNETFTIKRARTNIHNYIIGTMYVWNNGEMSCKNLKTGDIATLDLKKKGWTSYSDYVSDGVVKDKNNNISYDLYGKWNSFSQATNRQTKNKISLVKKKEEVKDHSLQYCFSKWSINANNLTKRMLDELPPTDSRFRPDQRAYEYGDFELTGTEKTRLENNQRTRRKNRKDNNIVYKPLWFDVEMDGKKITKCLFNGKYWEAKKNRKWPESCINIFN